MYFEQFYLGCLAHASYLLGSEGEAIVVDPQRDVDIYLEAVQKQGLKIQYIFETHMHADFVSGHRELAARTGANIYLARAAGATFPHIAVDDGYTLHVGKLKLEVQATPGHTPEHVCLLVTDRTRADEPWFALTGHTLMAGDVGRTELAADAAAGARILFKSLARLRALPDHIEVLPGAYAGSVCGRRLSGKPFSTIGFERRFNAAFRIATEDAFVEFMLQDVPPAPEGAAELQASNSGFQAQAAE